MKKTLEILLLSFLLYVCHSCMNDDLYWNNINKNHVIPSRGVFIVNEGNFMYDNASLSYYDYATQEVENDFFFKATGIPLGDVAQSMTIHDSLGYIVVNNSGKIYVINVYTGNYVGKITGFTSPREIVIINDNKAYVSDLYSKSIAIVNLNELVITGFIDVNNHETLYYQHPTEQFVKYNKYVFTNCWSFDNKILIIDTETDKLIDSIEVHKQPISITLDKDNKLWVLTNGCYPGSPYGQEKAVLMRIDAGSLHVETSYEFPFGDYPSELCINGSRDTLFFINKHIYMHPIYSSNPPIKIITSSYQTITGGFYGLNIDPYCSEIFVANAKDMVQNGEVLMYSPDGVLISSFKVGINPRKFCFLKR